MGPLPQTPTDFVLPWPIMSNPDMHLISQGLGEGWAVEFQGGAENPSLELVIKPWGLRGGIWFQLMCCAIQLQWSQFTRENPEELSRDAYWVI